ncbi:glycoside hydrolase family 3 C-terminal domain-containing protein [Paludicola sp. MB14-C6]|uniref:glycoside hydrolase family 3 C-terminal domain-containing protein n=1 Tax=Paludihabitans sp. MB14-C6 TaxID=3070656 RepID=UPI0027DDCE2D|nr:glycoside hydrolase family 3 C-terminal domain-containing protein [Paludicola sp. MB14-C6]WMJ23516.1 glycoside hydrolase family 3 C-terminal domain-containing protein [Paludicola sp. MB14-C6]
MKVTVNPFESVLSKAKELVEQMTLSEKASLCSGKDFWHTKGIERLGVKSLMLTDGPYGLRKQDGDSDHLGINNSVPATCFPAGVSTACSFDRDLLYEMGVAIGEECIQENVGIVLGPAANIKRSPLCGRNFEYISEDPLVTGEMAASFIKGVQSQNVGTSLKHYLANNQEKARLVSNSVVDERALREIYLCGFEIAVKKTQPWTLMCAYNKINGIYASDNKRMMTDIPREEWGFKGAIVTDWGAMNNRVEAVKAGLDLEMPAFNDATDKQIIEAVQEGELDKALVDICAMRMTAIALQAKKNKTKSYDANLHNELARRIARESAVLLKLGDALPANKKVNIALIGEFANTPRFQGAGSSRISPLRITSFIEALDTEKINYSFASGYKMDDDEPNDERIAEAVEVANKADVVFVFVGLPDRYESEGFDRTNLDMPKAHNKLVEKLAATGKKIVAVISTGGVVNIPWRDQVDSILLMNLCGQNSGYAAFDLLFGDYSPCGKLAETYPLSLADTPSINHFGTTGNIEYRESIYVGYRYYDKAQKQVMYPFGYGLSYTAFSYSDLIVSEKNISNSDTLTVNVMVTNTGKMLGKEIVQLYVEAPESTIFKPISELRDFAKVELQPNESKTISFTLDSRAFAYYNVNIKDWFVESGVYTIGIGASSRDIRLSDTVTIKSNQNGEIPDYRNSAPLYYNLISTESYDVPKEQFKVIYGGEIPAEHNIKPFTNNSTLGEIQSNWIGRIVNKKVNKMIDEMFRSDSDDLSKMIKSMVSDMPLRQFALLTKGELSPQKVDGLVSLLNGHLLRGASSLRK